MIDLSLKTLTKSQIEMINDEIELSLVDLSKRDEYWKILHESFKDGSTKNQFKYFSTFWRWYTMLTWRRINELSYEEFVNIAIGRQIPMALLLGFDVFDKIIHYLWIKSTDPKEMESVYLKVRNAFFESPAILGEEAGTELTLSWFIKEIRILYNRGSDSIQLAHLFSKMQSVFFEKLDEEMKKKILVEKDDIINALVELTHFFTGVEGDGIYVIVDAMKFPEHYMDREEDVSIQKDVQPNISKEEPKIDEIILKEEPESNDVVLVPEKKEEPLSPADKVEVDYGGIHRMIDERFIKDEDGNYVNIEGVLTLLSTLADQYGDEKVRDLYYFDETKGGFIWDQTLLNG